MIQGSPSGRGNPTPLRCTTAPLPAVRRRVSLLAIFLLTLPYAFDCLAIYLSRSPEHSREKSISPSLRGIGLIGANGINQLDRNQGRTGFSGRWKPSIFLRRKTFCW